ncbi:unnamed protein product [Prorocentrum cordatum]|uniref:Uncharacterized protein n=1 Tax=Prorocentrum cordatum TaxID=2364126 RepID=A0ABN9PW10_9DINO|nr:unnamed protein product [Polarella glacialis]
MWDWLKNEFNDACCAVLGLLALGAPMASPRLSVSSALLKPSLATPFLLFGLPLASSTRAVEMGRSEGEMGAPSEVNAPAEAPRKTVSKRPSPVPPGPPGSGSGMEFLGCFLCQGGGDLCECWFGKPLRRQCMLAVRPRRRAAMGTPAALNDQADMNRDPEKWRATHLPYLDKDTRKAAIHDFKTTHKQQESNMSIDGGLSGCEDVWLTRVRYRGFMGFWEGLSKEEADERFDGEFDANPKRNKKNQQVVLAEGNEYVKHEAGAESKRGVVENTPIGDEGDDREYEGAETSPCCEFWGGELLGRRAARSCSQQRRRPPRGLPLQEAVKEIAKGFEGKATTYARLTRLADRHKDYPDLPRNLTTVWISGSCNAELDSMRVDPVSLWADATELAQSLELIDKEIQTTKRKTYLQDRHQSQKARAKAQTTMVADEEGDSSTYRLQPISSCGIAIDANMSAFNPSRLFGWKTPFACFQDVLVDIGGPIDERCSRLNENLAANRDIWLGAQANVDSKSERGEHLEFLPGLGPHLCCIVRNALRLGAMAVPLPAFACFMPPLNGSMFALAHDVAEVLNQEVFLTDIQTFLKSSSGEGFLKSKHAACVTFQSWLRYLHVPFLNAEVAKTVDAEVFKAASALPAARWVPLQASMWVERRKGFSDFV